MGVASVRIFEYKPAIGNPPHGTPPLSPMEPWQLSSGPSQASSLAFGPIQFKHAEIRNQCDVNLENGVKIQHDLWLFLCWSRKIKLIYTSYASNMWDFTSGVTLSSKLGVLVLNACIFFGIWPSQMEVSWNGDTPQIDQNQPISVLKPMMTLGSHILRNIQMRGVEHQDLLIWKYECDVPFKYENLIINNRDICINPYQTILFPNLLTVFLWWYMMT